MYSTMPADWLCCAYLRKSREDEQRDRDFEGDTLARHQQIIEDLAEDNGHTLRQWYREVVSGETIAGRPEMTELLRDVAQGKWNAVYVVEASRLGRGGGADQERIVNAFKYTNTWIITESSGTYDPNSPSDMRRLKSDLRSSEDELDSITTRLMRGKLRAAKDGRWLTPGRTPYGWRAVRLRGVWQLEPDGNNGTMLKMYDMADDLAMTTYAIAEKLMEWGVRTAQGGYRWTAKAVERILLNWANCGYVVYGVHKTEKVFDPETFEVVKKTTINPNPIMVKGLHYGKGGVSEEKFARVAAMLRGRAKTNRSTELCNPLASLIKCGKCGYGMRYKKLKTRKGLDDHYFSHQEPKRMRCSCEGARMAHASDVMSLLAESLTSICADIELKIAGGDPGGASGIEALESELAKARASAQRAMEAYEAGVYSLDDYAARKRSIEMRVAEIEQAITRETRRKPLPDVVVGLRECIAAIADESKTAAQKNELLRGIIDRIDYYRDEEHGLRLEIFLR